MKKKVRGRKKGQMGEIKFRIESVQVNVVMATTSNGKKGKE